MFLPNMPEKGRQGEELEQAQPCKGPAAARAHVGAVQGRGVRRYDTAPVRFTIFDPSGRRLSTWPHFLAATSFSVEFACKF